LALPIIGDGVPRPADAKHLPMDGDATLKDSG